MSVIFKYQLEPDGGRVVMMPQGARILSVQHLDYAIWAWALVPDPKAWTEPRRFELDWTGETLPLLEPGMERKHLATLRDHVGLVWHVFEIVDKNKEVV